MHLLGASARGGACVSRALVLPQEVCRRGHHQAEFSVRRNCPRCPARSQQCTHLLLRHPALPSSLAGHSCLLMQRLLRGSRSRRGLLRLVCLPPLRLLSLCWDRPLLSAGRGLWGRPRHASTVICLLRTRPSVNPGRLILIPAGVVCLLCCLGRMRMQAVAAVAGGLCT